MKDKPEDIFAFPYSSEGHKRPWNFPPEFGWKDADESTVRYALIKPGRKKNIQILVVFIKVDKVPA